MIQHHIEACAKVGVCAAKVLFCSAAPMSIGPFLTESILQVPNMKEILLIGFYQPNEELTRFLMNAQQEFKISIR